MQSTPQKSYGPAGDRELGDLYGSFGATTAQQKIKVLEAKLGQSCNYYAFGGQLNDDMKLGALEYDYLSGIGKIELVLA